MVFGLFGDKDLQIGVDVEGPADKAYRPGDTVRAIVTVEAKKGGRFREMRAGLLCWQRYQAAEEDYDSEDGHHTDYVWRTDESWVTKEMLVGDEQLPSGFSQRYTFEWTLPTDAPPTYDGKILKNRWLIKVTADRKMAKDINEERELQVVATALETDVQGGPSGPGNAPDVVRFDLSLPKLAWSEGETVTGQLHVDPQKEFSVREARLELLRVERVTKGDKTHTHSEVVQRAQLASKPSFTPGTPVVYDFSLAIPEASKPSHASPCGDVTWALQASLDRPMAEDYVVRQAIAVSNG